MIVRYMESKMPSQRIDTSELKEQIFRKLGKEKAVKYFFNLSRLLSSKLSKIEFDKFCRGIMGKETIRLHNLLIRSVINNACHGPPSGWTTTGHSRSTVTSDDPFGEVFHVSPRKSRSITSRERRLNDRPSPLGLYGRMPSGCAIEVDNSCDVQRSREQQRAHEMISIDSKALLGVASVEDGEEVEQVRGSPIVQCKTPVSPPLGLGIPIISGASKRRAYGSVYADVLHLPKSEIPESCRISSILPDALSLRKQLKHKLETEGLNLSEDYIGLLNHGLDAYLKRLIKPCVALARTRYSKSLCLANGKFQPRMQDFGYENSLRRSNQCYSASLVDFKVAMQSNPQLLGVDWPVQLEKICLFPSIE